jgi:hypothetical protein
MITHQRIRYDFSAGTHCLRGISSNHHRARELQGMGGDDRGEQGVTGEDVQTTGGGGERGVERQLGAGFAVCSTEAVLTSAQNRRNSRLRQQHGLQLDKLALYI